MSTEPRETTPLTPEQQEVSEALDRAFKSEAVMKALIQKAAYGLLKVPTYHGSTKSKDIIEDILGERPVNKDNNVFIAKTVATYKRKAALLAEAIRLYKALLTAADAAQADATQWWDAEAQVEDGTVKGMFRIPAVLLVASPTAKIKLPVDASNPKSETRDATEDDLLFLNGEGYIVLDGPDVKSIRADIKQLVEAHRLLKDLDEAKSEKIVRNLKKGVAGLAELQNGADLSQKMIEQVKTLYGLASAIMTKIEKKRA